MKDKERGSEVMERAKECKTEIKCEKFTNGRTRKACVKEENKEQSRGVS